MEHSMITQKLKNRIIFDPAIPSIYPQKLKQWLRYLQPHVHSSITYNNQEVGATQVFNPLMNGYTVCGVYTHSGVSFSFKKEILVCYNIDEPWAHYVKWKSQSQKNKYYMVTFM